MQASLVSLQSSAAPPEGHGKFAGEDVDLVSGLELQPAQLPLPSQQSAQPLPAVGHDHLPALAAELHLSQLHGGDLLLVLQVQVVVGSQHHCDLEVGRREFLGFGGGVDALLGVDHVLSVGGGVGQRLLGLEVDCVLLLVQEGSCGLPDGLIAEKHILIIHLDSRQEDGVLHGRAEIRQQRLESIPRLQLQIPLAEIIQLLGQNGEEVVGEFSPDLLLAVALLERVDLEGEEGVVVGVDVHVEGGVAEHGLLERLADLHLLLREHGVEVGDEFAVEVSDQLQVAAFALHQVLHLQVAVLCEVGVS